MTPEAQFIAAYTVFCAGVLGLALGSFANVVIYRVPAGVSVVKPPSACPNCHERIRARDNVPVLGWLVLRGKCRDCHAPISPRYPLVELATGLLFTVVALRFGLSWLLLPYLFLAWLAVVLTMTDLDTMRLPNKIVYPSWPAAAVLLALPAVLEPGDGRSLLRALLGTLALGGLYAGLFLLTLGKGMGLGDVKLAPALGALLAFLGWPHLIVGGLSAFLYGSLIGVVLIARSKAGGKTAVPFGPFMLAGALTGALAGRQIADAWLGLFALG